MEIVLHEDVASKIELTGKKTLGFTRQLKKQLAFLHDEDWLNPVGQLLKPLGIQDKKDLKIHVEKHKNELIRQCVEPHPNPENNYNGNVNNLTRWSNLHFFLNYVNKKLTREDVQVLLNNRMIQEHYEKIEKNIETFSDVFWAMDWAFFHNLNYNIDWEEIIQYFPESEIDDFIVWLVSESFKNEFSHVEWQEGLRNMYASLRHFLSTTKLCEKEPYKQYYHLCECFSSLKIDSYSDLKEFAQEIWSVMFGHKDFENIIAWKTNEAKEGDIVMQPHWSKLEEMVEKRLKRCYDERINKWFEELLMKSMNKIPMYKTLLAKHVWADTQLQQISNQLSQYYEWFRHNLKEQYYSNQLQTNRDNSRSINLSKTQSEYLINALESINKVTQKIDQMLLIPLYERTKWLYTVWWKIHFSKKIDQEKLYEFKQKNWFSSTMFKMIHSGSSMLLPVTYTAEALILFIQALIEQWLFQEDCELQICNPWRLPNNDVWILVSAVLLSSKRCPLYTPESFKTTHDDMTWARIAAYDAWVLSKSFDSLPNWISWRTDILWRSHFEDVIWSSLVHSLLWQTHYWWRFATLWVIFRKEYIQLLKKYGIESILERQWVYDHEKDELSDQLDHYHLVKSLTDRWQSDTSDLIETWSEQWLLSFDIKKLLQKYRNAILSRNSLWSNQIKYVWKS